MKLISLFIAACVLASRVGAQAPAIRIMPLGDSITDGTAVGTAGLGGYRGPLYTSLTAAGYNVDYVGTLSNNGAGIPDPHHEGHGGWRIDQLDSNMTGWLNSLADPDVVLMHIGTNDFGQSFNTATAIDRLDGLILKIATQRPYAHIIVTNLMERGEPTNGNIQSLFNPQVQGKVAAHAAAGRRVYFLDMRAAVPLTDMPDNLHPNQTGYNKMAAAWLPAIQAVISPEGDTAPPALWTVRTTATGKEIQVKFSKPVADTAATVANFAVSGGITVTNAVLDAGKRVVTLTTSELLPATNYTLTVNNIQDRLTVPNSMAAGSTLVFQRRIPRGYQNHVPESTEYTLAASLEIPSLALWGGAALPYTGDIRPQIGEFDRVAYYLELENGAGDFEYLWVSMPSYTTDSMKLGVPTVASGAVFQQAVSEMNVFTNKPGVPTGTGIAGNLEFWPTNYSALNSGVAGASDTLYDAGDTMTPGTYGSMQIHATESLTTLLAFNNWGAATGTPGDVDLGIGNAPSPLNGGQDWTFQRNGATYTARSLQVLVRTTKDQTRPTLISAVAGFNGARVVVTFSEPLTADSLLASNFSLNENVAVLAATVSAANPREVVLATTALPAGVPLTVSVSNVRDTSANANAILPASTIAVTPAVLPSEIIANVGAASQGYKLVYSADLPVRGDIVRKGAGAYRHDESADRSMFSRVAYYLELVPPTGPSRWVWVSVDAFTPNRTKLGLPTFASGAIFQQNVSQMEVLSNVAGVVNGTTAAGGNIEFWPTNYTQANALSVVNASATTYDFGDTRSTTGDFGCLQIHNHDAGAVQTVLAINHFGTDGNVLDVGIGNQPTGSPDWTNAANAGSFVRRTLHVLALPGSSTPAPVVSAVPEAQNYQLVYSLNVPATGNLVSGAGFTNYAVNYSQDVGTFSRVAYYMELQKTGDAGPSYVWASMDAFTALAGRIGIPTPASGAVFQQVVNNLNVFSNVPGVVTGTGITTGNIEFWPTNFSQPNALNIPGASATTFDFGDTRSTTGTHGSFQIHNHGASQVLMALNNWGTAANAANVLSIGLGTNPNAAQAPDYTLTANAASFDVKRLLQVYILPGGDTAPPSVVRVVPSITRNRLIITFNEQLADSSASLGNVSIPGLTVERVRLMPNGLDLAVETSPQTAGTSYTLMLTNLRDRSPAANLLVSASATVLGHETPAILTNVPEASEYKLAYRLALPTAAAMWNVNTIPYSLDESKYGEQLFDRVAYLLELDSNWAYASFDRHTNAISKVGVPTLAVSPTAMAQRVTNMNVLSNVPSIQAGTGITTGNIEFWGGNYSGPNALAIPNANVTTFDFGDTMTAGGYGTLQIHNFQASQVIMAYNNWGSAATNSEVGIGNHPTPSATASGAQTDWTFSLNANTVTTKNLYVLIRPGGAASGPLPAIHALPQSQSLQAGGRVALSVAVTGTGPFRYQWRKNGVAIEGATQSWFEIPAGQGADSGSYDVLVTAGNLTEAVSPAAIISISPPALAKLQSIQRQASGDIVLRYTGTPNAAYHLERSSDLVEWTLISQPQADGNGELNITDNPPQDVNRHFYRMSLP